jgi:hypothetical protein
MQECTTAFVFFKTRYAALIASEILQTSNPMKWVANLAPEPEDVYWSNLWLPYKQLWARRIATLLGSIFFMFIFLIPVTFIQGLSQLEQLQQRLPFLRGILKKWVQNFQLCSPNDSIKIILIEFDICCDLMLLDANVFKSDDLLVVLADRLGRLITISRTTWTINCNWSKPTSTIKRD